MIKAIFRSPVTTAVLFIVAAALLLGGTVGAVSAAPRIQSNDYYAQAKLTNIETALTELQGGKVNAAGKYEGGSFVEVNGDKQIAMKFLAEAGDESLILGKTYNEQLSVRNVGTIPQYVRVAVKKYWVTGDGKRVDLNPEFIELHFTNSDKWKEDKSAATDEQRVFYYTDIVNPGGETKPFTDTLTIDPKVATEATGKSAVAGSKFDYKNVEFRIQARVDAVQTHNGKDAMTSAWGRTN